MDLGCFPFCLVAIAPGNQMGTLRGPPPYLVGISPYVTIYGHGIPTGQGVQSPG